MIQSPSPRSEQELLENAAKLAGWSLGELAAQHNIRAPKDFKREKGWTGQLLELCLGATAGSNPQQDFPNLGIELKTLPLSYQGTPLETTYVCYAPLVQLTGISWETSNVRNKLQKVLWVPIQGERQIAPAERQVGTPFMWQPTAQQDAALRQDWEELMDMIVLGQVEQITAKIGEVMQLRPKAADGSALTDAIGAHGQMIQTRPRGFYLRKNFTQQILSSVFSE